MLNRGAWEVYKGANNDNSWVLLYNRLKYGRSDRWAIPSIETLKVSKIKLNLNFFVLN